MPLCKLFSCVYVRTSVLHVCVYTLCDLQQVVGGEWPGSSLPHPHRTQLSGKVIIALHFRVLSSNSQGKIIIFKNSLIFVTIFNFLMFFVTRGLQVLPRNVWPDTNLVLIGSEWGKEIFLFTFGNFMPYFLGYSAAKFKMEFSIFWSFTWIMR